MSSKFVFKMIAVFTGFYNINCNVSVPKSPQVCLLTFFYWNEPIIEFSEACLILPLINCQANVIANRKSIDGGQLRPCWAIFSDMIIDALELRPMTEQQTWASLSLAVIDVSKIGFIMHISFGLDIFAKTFSCFRILYRWVSIILSKALYILTKCMGIKGD